VPGTRARMQIRNVSLIAKVLMIQRISNNNNSQKTLSKQGANRGRTSPMKKGFLQSKRLQARSTGINTDIDDEEDYDHRYVDYT
jgi:hypothetical protein